MIIAGEYDYRVRYSRNPSIRGTETITGSERRTDYTTSKEELIMILKHQIITDIRIESVNDLYKLKPFLEDGTLKINKSQIARELEVDRRTVDKYINGYTKPETRNCDDCITPFYDTITELLSDKNQQVFYDKIRSK